MKSRAPVVFVVLGLIASSLTGVSVGLRTRPAGAIVGGNETSIENHPWMVSLFKRTEPRGHFCSGFILDRATVVTAAHCVSDHVEPGDFFVRAGVTSRHSAAGQNLGVRSMTVHPWHSTFGVPDIAVLKVSRAFRFAETVQPIALANSAEVAATRNGAVAGWGIRLPSATTSAHNLIEARVKLLSDATCSGQNRLGRRFQSSWLNLKPRGELCSFAPRVSTCTGDSGAPLVIRTADGTPKVAGLTTRGFDCTGRYPAVYAQTESFRRWIQTQ